MQPNNLRRFVKRVIAGKYEGVDACFFFGSGNLGDINEGSDLDNIVISSSAIHPVHEHHAVAGWLFDVYVLSEESLGRIIESQLRRHVDYFCRALMSSTVLIDRNGVSTRILDLARKRLKALPPFTDWLPLRLAITTLIRDVKFSRACTERVAACVELYTLILKCWVLSNGYFLGSTKHMATLVMYSDTRFSEDLRLAYLDAAQGRSERFIGIAEEQLLVIGGYFNSGDKLYLSNESRNSLSGRT